MTKVPKYWNKAKIYLSKKDKIISRLIKLYKSPSETILTSRRDIFFSLCKSIIGQQISVAAANSVFKKFQNKCKNKINPKTVSNLTNQKLKQFAVMQENECVGKKFVVINNGMEINTVEVNDEF